MTMATDLFLGKVHDLQSKVSRSAQDIIREGGWFFKRIATYTEESPLVVTAGTTVNLPIPANDTGEQQGNLFNFSYDYTNQLFRPNTTGEVYLTEIKFMCKPTQKAGHLDLILEIPDYPFNPINGTTLTFNKSAGEEHFFSSNFIPFISQEFADNGARLMVHAAGTDVSIYNYNFMFVRLHSNKG
jgi:hypothetical protein